MSWYVRRCHKCNNTFPQHDDMPDTNLCPVCEERVELSHAIRAAEDQLMQMNRLLERICHVLENGVRTYTPLR